MKLRNKKTGEVIDAGCRTTLNGNFWITRSGGGKPIYMNFYESLAELNEEWEDCEPKKPLIKDEKIRKAVRTWAEANEVVKAFVVLNEHMNWTIHGDDIDHNRFRIEFFDRVVSENDLTKNYTITELCGEEKECES